MNRSLTSLIPGVRCPYMSLKRWMARSSAGVYCFDPDPVARRLGDFVCAVPLGSLFLGGCLSAVLTLGGAFVFGGPALAVPFGGVSGATEGNCTVEGPAVAVGASAAGSGSTESR